MSNMKQKVEKSTPQGKTASKKTNGAKINSRKAKLVNVEKTNGDIPVLDVNENKKRKIESRTDEIEIKKSRNSEKIDNVPELEINEAKATLESQKNIDETSNKRKVKSKSLEVKDTKTVKKARSTTAIKRQKVLLQVPRLPIASGVLFVMGVNDVGQIGMDVEILGKKRPTELLSHIRFVDIAAGAMHSVCLTSKGEVYTFGCNDEGALGRHTEEQEDECIPEKIDIPAVVVQVSAGDSHSAALTENGQVYIWGNFRNSNGVIGLLKRDMKCIKPQRILHNITVVSIASGSDHFVCLANDGQVYTCGNAEFGQLGRISERSGKGDSRKGLDELLDPRPIPLRSNLKPISDIWVGHCNTYLKSKSGSIYACGLNNFYQLGLPVVRDVHDQPKKFMYFTPVLVNSFEETLNWKQISAGQHHTLALDERGRVYALGRKEYGRLGFGENCDDAEVPTLIPTLQNQISVDISCGNIASFAVTDDGLAYSWGFGENHQLGHGNTDDIHEPLAIPGNFQNSWFAFKISGGSQHTLILANRKGTTSETETEK